MAGLAFGYERQQTPQGASLGAETGRAAKLCAARTDRVQQVTCRLACGFFRARGHACDREEHEPRIICCAAPILSRTGRVLGALSMSSSTSRTTLDALEAQAGRIKETAARIAYDAESWCFPEQD